MQHIITSWDSYFITKIRQKFISKCARFSVKNAKGFLHNTIVIKNNDDFIIKCDSITNCDSTLTIVLIFTSSSVVNLVLIKLTYSFYICSNEDITKG